MPSGPRPKNWNQIGAPKSAVLSFENVAAKKTQIRSAKNVECARGTVASMIVPCATSPLGSGALQYSVCETHILQETWAIIGTYSHHQQLDCTIANEQPHHRHPALFLTSFHVANGGETLLLAATVEPGEPHHQDLYPVPSWQRIPTPTKLRQKQ